MAAILTRSVNLTGDGEPERVEAYCVTANFFPLLGIRPALGRVFTANEDVPGANKVALISYGLWQRRFGGERNWVGPSMELNGEQVTVLKS
jgi:putative ABC transport system permease protein